MSKNVVKNIGTNSSSKFGQKPRDRSKQSARDAFETDSKRAI